MRAAKSTLCPKISPLPYADAAALLPGLTPKEYAALTAESLDKLREARAAAALCRNCQGRCRSHTPGFSLKAELDKSGQARVFIEQCPISRQKAAQNRLNRIFADGAIPAPYRNVTFADYKRTNANRAAVEAALHALKTKNSLYIYGSVGAGKTLLAACMATAAAKEGMGVLFASMPDLLLRLRQSLQKEDAGDVLCAVKTADFFILDDLGAERITPYSIEQLFIILNYRAAANLSTVITANYSPKELAAAIVKATGDQTAAMRIVRRIVALSQVVSIFS